MSFTLRKSSERGAGNHSCLQAKYFFLSNYFNKQNMRFGSLRVLNEDRVSGGKGFGVHEHKNMEIITYVLSGKIQHQDSNGNKGTIKYGDVQYMSAGSGIEHSEINALKKEVHLLQIWGLPSVKNTPPKYKKALCSKLGKTGKLLLLLSPKA